MRYNRILQVLKVIQVLQVNLTHLRVDFQAFFIPNCFGSPNIGSPCVLQVAAAKETKMNQSNLAKILGPTIIGYSSVEALPEEIMKEVGGFEN